MKLHCENFDLKKKVAAVHYLPVTRKSPRAPLILVCFERLCSLCCLSLFPLQSISLSLSSHTTTPDSVTCLCSFYHSPRGRGMAATFPEARHKGLRMDGWMARGTKPTAKLLSDTSLRFETHTHTREARRVNALERLAPWMHPTTRLHANSRQNHQTRPGALKIFTLPLEGTSWSLGGFLRVSGPVIAAIAANK